MRLQQWWTAVIALGLAGCGNHPTPASHDDAIATSIAATAPAGNPASSAPTTDAAEPSAVQGTTTYAGFGPAKFGATQEEVRKAWGRKMVGGPEDPEGCYYLYPEPRAQSSHRLAFMFEQQRFTRVDVDAAGIVAPGGGEVGMGVKEIRTRYPDLVEQPHKYVEGGRILRHADTGGSAIVFETDPSGTVTQWRVGMPPQVDYVEGCG